jgi:hypothetical protein
MSIPSALTAGSSVLLTEVCGIRTACYPHGVHRATGADRSGRGQLICWPPEVPRTPSRSLCGCRGLARPVLRPAF